jgi:hypothetical protein
MATTRIYSDYARVFDQSNKNWHKTESYNKIFLQCQQDWANDKLQAQGHIFLNEIYDMLSVPRTSAGAIVGWLRDSEQPRKVDFWIVDRPDGSKLIDFNPDGIIYDKI